MADANDGRVTLFNAPGSSIFGTERRTSAQREYIARPRPADDASGAEAIGYAHGVGQESAMRDAAAWLTERGMPNLGAALLAEFGCATLAASREPARDAVVEAVDAYCAGIHDPALRGKEHDKGHVERFGALLDRWKAYAALRRENGGA